jgi:hypothetical protein
VPENENRTVRARRGAPERSAPTQPHTVPSFWRLFGLYRRQTRPTSFDYGYADAGSGSPASWAELSKHLSLSSDRRRRYDIFDEMDGFGLVSAVLSVYAEEATQPDYDKGVRVWIESKAKHMIEAGNACLANCQIEDRVFAVTRRTCKYGDAFQRLLYASGKGVLGWRYASQSNMTRVEDKFGRLVGFKEEGGAFRKALHPKGTDTSFPWDYLHFRLLGKNEEDGYGSGLCEQFFREWRYMTLTEDAILMYRLRRMPDRNVVLVDVGSLEDHEAMRYVNQWRKRLRKHEIVDPASATYRKQWNPIGPLEDLFYPIRQDSNTRIETLQGGGNIGDIYDLEHFRDAFFGSAAVPKAYFGFEGEIDAKATLQQQDIRFARTAKRIQRATIYGIRQLLDVHFTLLGTPQNKGKYDPLERDNEYLVMMSPISYLEELERLELVRMRYEIVQTMTGLKNDLQLDARMWAVYILVNFARLPDELVMRLIQQTAEKPVEGRGEAFKALPLEQQKQILDNDRTELSMLRPLTEEDKRWIHLCVAQSPGLQHRIRRFEELASDEVDYLARQQIDTSLLPVEVAGNGDNYLLQDDYEEEAAIKQLNEDVRVLRRAAEAAQTIEIQLNEGQAEATPEQIEEAIRAASSKAAKILEDRKKQNAPDGPGREQTSEGARLAGQAASGKAYVAKTTGKLGG